MPADPRLRVAMLVESSVVPAWLGALAARLDATPFVDLDVFTLGESGKPAPQPFPSRVYEGLERRLFRCRPAALDPVGIDALPRPATLEGRDVILDFASLEPAALARGTRYGAWVLTHGLADEPFMYRVQIEAVLESGTGVVLHSSYGATDPASLHRTRNQALWKAQGAYVHRLETVRRLGRAYFESRSRASAGQRTESAQTGSSALAVARRATGVASGVARRRMRRIREREAWFIASRPRLEPPLTGLASDSRKGFAPIEWPSQTAVADPFVIEEGGETYVFFEDYDPGAGRAHISYLRLDADARASTPVATALAAPYHLSYPFVFRHDGEIFMIPESSASRTIELYRACPFPSTWTREQILLHGVRAFDATLFADEGRLWLFTNLAEEGAAPNDELHLFSSAALSGPWEPHPANPVVSDVRSARPAGRIFRHGADLIRPSQDCSRRYGYALVFNRIDVLSDSEYSETPVGRIEPDWLPGLVATHTYNFGDSVEVIDGKRVVRKPLLGRLRR